jgi:hypothetical protein
MRDDIRCEDHAALVGFLYDDCEADERARIRAHLAVCAQCAEELESLSMTREQLSAWTPPDAQLGFRVNPVGVSPARHAAWWSRPLPAWAQLAAAVVIFAAGSLAGLMAGSTSVTMVSAPPSPGAQAANVALTRIERRLDALEFKQAPDRQTLVRYDNSSREGVLQQVNQLIAESEQRNQQQISLVAMQVLRDSSNDTKEQLKLAEQKRRAEDLIQSKLVSAVYNSN